MNHHLTEHNIAFKTSRLSIVEVRADLDSKLKSELLSRTTDLLSPRVVQSLPPFFQDISSPELAEIWLNKMLSESRFLLIKNIGNDLSIGFIFLYEGECSSVHIGYLLGEEYWGKGYAKECLTGLINWCASQESISKLVGGVEKTNVASSKLLENLGFVEKVGKNEPVVFYEYQLS